MKKIELTMEDSLKREKGMIFPQDFSDHTRQAVAHSRNCMTALEKQIAKVPQNIKNIKFTGCIREQFKKGDCPRCNSYVDTDDDFKFCSECGQKLNWKIKI